MQLKKLNDVFPNWLTSGGIFSELEKFPVPWKGEGMALSLDMEYYGNVSGQKYISPLVYSLMNNDESIITPDNKRMLAMVVTSIYSRNWDKLWQVQLEQYDPIENYSMREIMNDSSTTTYGKVQTRTDNLSHSKTGTETQALDITETRTDDLARTKTGTETCTPDITETRTDNLTHDVSGADTRTPETTETRTDNLIHDITGTDTRTPKTTETKTNDLSHTKTGTDTETPNITETTTPDLTNVSSNRVFGFNSTEPVEVGGGTQNSSGTNKLIRTGSNKNDYNTTDKDTGTQTTVLSGTDKTERSQKITDTGTQITALSGIDKTERTQKIIDTGTQTTSRTGTEKNEYNLTDKDTGTQTNVKAGTDTLTHNVSDIDTGTQKFADGGEDANKRNYELTRAGNIGVTTSQQMLESEISLWKWNFFRDVVFPDMDKVLTLKIY